MASVSAQDLTKTYYCKAPGCENESRSPVGKYSYCTEHMGTASTTKAAQNGSTRAVEGAEGALRNLLALAKSVDRAKAKAEKAQRAANDANRKADALEDEYKAALAMAARGTALIAG